MPVPTTPLGEGKQNLHGCLLAVLGMIVVGVLVVALYLWCGRIGRAVLAGVGYGVAGMLTPFFSGTSPHSANQERFLFYFGIVLGVVGLCVGIGIGYSNIPLDRWVFILAGMVLVVASGWGTHRWAMWRMRRPITSRKNGSPGPSSS